MHLGAGSYFGGFDAFVPIPLEKAGPVGGKVGFQWHQGILRGIGGSWVSLGIPAAPGHPLLRLLLPFSCATHALPFLEGGIPESKGQKQP